MEKKNKAVTAEVKIPGIAAEYHGCAVYSDGGMIREPEAAVSTPARHKAAVCINHFPFGENEYRYQVAVSPAMRGGQVFRDAYLEKDHFMDAPEAVRTYIEAARRWVRADAGLETCYSDAVRGALSQYDPTKFGICLRPSNFVRPVVMFPSWEHPGPAWVNVIDREAVVRTPENGRVSVIMKHDRSTDPLVGRNTVYEVKVCPVTADGRVAYRDFPLGKCFTEIEQAENFFETVGSWRCDDHNTDLKELSKLFAI